MTHLSRARAGAVVETVGTLLLVATLALEIVHHSLHAEAVLCFAAGALFLAAAALSPEARRSWLAIISGISLVIAVALLVRIVEAPLLNGLHLVPLTLIACAVAIGHRSALRSGTLQREWTRARRDGEERERRHWARELHDDTLQELGAVQIVLAGATASSRPDVMKDAIDQARRLIGNQITSLRRLIAELRPAALDQLGLRPALEALCRSTSENFGIDAELRVGADWDRFGAELPPEAQVHVYRIVQQAVNNAVKHARPTRILVELDSDDHGLFTKVTDDGRGMTPEPAPSAMRTPPRATASGGMGIAAMRERAHLLDAHLTVDSAPREGTRVTLRMPRRVRGGRGHRPFRDGRRHRP
ncbi:sensor histidine kinase [Streptomyces sp. L-9-10]|uniref:sensor histidine kinase n=1 Tax=Streptomyces sp. L-9-10 TaxID=1478131 RepID=UPI00101C486D|nr:sensor histidine kinase [Streptomyces sp. L-9-10]